MKKRFITLIMFLCTFAVNQSNASEFTNEYIPDGMNVEFKVPLEEYLKLLASSSGYDYVPGKGKFRCNPVKIPMYIDKRSIDSIGDLKTVYEALRQIGLIVPDGYNIAISEYEKLISLTCGLHQD